MLNEILEGDADRIAKYKVYGKLCKTTIINNDYNFNNEIEKAFILNESMAQKLLLEKVLTINTIDYQSMMM